MAQTQARRTEPADPQLLALKVPPHSVEAEQSLLGGLLLDNQAFDKIADLVSAEDFYRDDHRRLYRVRRHLEREQLGIRSIGAARLRLGHGVEPILEQIPAREFQASPITATVIVTTTSVCSAI